MVGMAAALVHAQTPVLPDDQDLAPPSAPSRAINSLPGSDQTHPLARAWPVTAGIDEDVRHRDAGRGKHATVLDHLPLLLGHLDTHQTTLNPTPPSPCPFAARTAMSTFDRPRTRRHLVEPI